MNEPIDCRVTITADDFIMDNHRVHGVPVLPGVTFLDIIWRVMAAAGTESTDFVLRNVVFPEPVTFVVPGDRELRIRIGVADDDDRRTVHVTGRPAEVADAPWREHARAVMEPCLDVDVPTVDLAAATASAVGFGDMTEVYTRARGKQVHHRDRMSCDGRLLRQPDGVVATLELRTPDTDPDGRFHLHPALMDASTLVAFGQRDDVAEEAYLPFVIDYVRAPGCLPHEVTVRVPARETSVGNDDLLRNDLTLHDADGRMLAELRGMTCKRVRHRELITAGPRIDPAPTPAPPPVVSPVTDVTRHLIERVARLVGREIAEIRPDIGFYDLGLDSVALLRLGEELEDLVGSSLYPTLLFEHGDIASLTRYLLDNHTVSLPVVEPEPGMPAPDMAVPDRPKQAGAAPMARLHRPEWARHDLVERPDWSGTIVLLGSAALADRLRGAGRRVILTTKAPIVHRIADDHYGADCENPGDLAELLALLAADGAVIDGVVAEASRPGGDLNRGEPGAIRLWAWATALAGSRTPPTPWLLWLHVDNTASDLATSALAATISAETPTVRCRSVYFDEAIDPAAVLAEATDLASATTESAVRYHGGARHLRRWRELSLEAVPASAATSGTHVITGGAGGIGAILARHLVETGRARHLLLMGRRERDRQVSTVVERLTELGATVEYLCGDVTVPADVDRVVAAGRRFGRIAGVWHCAGETDDRVYFGKSAESLRRTWSAKVTGTVLLDEATRADAPDWFVLFSSLSAFRPNPGQSDYAFGNAFQAHYAAQRAAAQQGDTGRSLAVAWPLWADGGMAPKRDDSADPAGLLPLPTDIALAALETALAGAESSVAVTYGVDTDGVLPEVVVHTRPIAAGSPPEPTREAAAEPIAVIGMAGQYPQAPDLDRFWRNLLNGVDAITDVPESRWEHDRYFDPREGQPGRTYSRWGGFLDNPAGFDPRFFAISRREAESMDPQERLFLMTGWHALEDAGYPPVALTGLPVGVYTGVMWNHYQLYTDDAVAPTAMHAAVANRVSHCLNLTGPSMAVDTACSSSLTAIHLAIRAIRDGECDMALAGGVNLTIHPQKYLQLSRGRFLSTDGRCRSFGADADGYVPGEGVGAVVLKPLSRAVADGDHIHGVIVESVLNHNGRSSGFTVPDPVGQADLIEAAMNRAGWSADSVGYLEAHGTGTSLGDPIEIDGLNRALGSGTGTCVVGSVKSNIGHLESAAGIAGLSKVLLQLTHRTIVGSLHSETVNPAVDLSSGRFRIPQRAEVWPQPPTGERRAGISAFGAGGANAHLLVAEAPPRTRSGRPPAGDQLVILSARDENALRDYVDRYRRLLAERASGTDREWLLAQVADLLDVPVSEVDAGESLESLGLDRIGLRRLADVVTARTGRTMRLSATMSLAELSRPDDPWFLADLAYTLQVGREPLPVRLAVVCSDESTLAEALTRFADGRPPANGQYWQPMGHADGDADSRAATADDELSTVARSWVDGAEIDWRDRHPAPVPMRRRPLPGYPFQLDDYWLGRWRRDRGGPDESVTPPVREPVTIEPAEPPSDDAGEPAVDYRVLESGIALIRMRGRTNMFTPALMAGLQDAFRRVNGDPDVSVVVLAGGEDVFSMGGTPDALADLTDGRTRFTDAPFVFRGLLECDRPVIAAMAGHASGGGLAFGLYADIVVMARESVYSANFLKHGFTPGMGATYIVEQRLGRTVAAEMFYTATGFTGAELEQRGAGVGFADRDRVLSTALSLAQAVARHEPHALRVLKRGLGDRALVELEPVITDEARMHHRVFSSTARSQPDPSGEMTARPASASHHDVTEPTPDQRPHSEQPMASSPPIEPVTLPPLASEAARPQPVSPDGATERDVIAVVTRSLSNHLYLDVADIDHAETFHELGLDSIGAVEVVRDLNSAFGLSLDSVTVYDHPTVTALSAHVGGHIAGGRRLVASVAAVEEPVGPVESRRGPSGAPAAVTLSPVEVPTVSNGGRSPSEPAEAEPAEPEPPRSEAGRPPPPGATVPAPAPAPTNETASPTPIAVIGMAGRFPDAPTLEDFWSNLEAGRDSVTEVPPHRWEVDRYFDPDRRRPGRTYSKWAALLDDVDRFDAGLFRISPLEAESMDPQQRVFLETAWQAIEDAGYPTITDESRRWGVFLGCASGEYTELLRDAGIDDTAHAFLGNSSSVTASRIAYRLNLTGPTLAVDTACSSSLVAVHLAMEAIRSGQCEVALAGGVALMLTPRMHIWASKSGMLSPQGRSAPFGADASGIVLGEGSGAVLLKPLDRAVADGDQIHGVIVADGVNGDGRTNGLTAPSATSQAELIRRVHARTPLAADLGYIEAHGTGTPLGDPIEVKALNAALPDGGSTVLIGSVKGNIGHTTMAAGVAGLLKVLLALRHRRIPPSINIDGVNPDAEFADGRLAPATRLTEWAPGPNGRRVAAVSGFGFSGTNAHLVVADAPARAEGDLGTGEALITLSAPTEESLARTASDLAARLARDPVPLADVAHTLATGRYHFAVRAAAVVTDLSGLIDWLRSGPRPGEVVEIGPAGIDRDELTGLAADYVVGGDVDRLGRCCRGRRVSLPGVALANSRFHPRPRLDSVASETGRTPADDWTVTPDDPLVADHGVGGRPVIAGAALLALIADRTDTAPVRVESMRWHRPVPVDDGAVTVSTRRTHGTVELHVTGIDGPVATAKPHPAPPNPAAYPSDEDRRCPETVDVDDLYREFAAAGIRYGPTYRVLTGIRRGRHQVTATYRLGDTTGHRARAIMLDAAMQVLAVLPETEGGLPFAVDTVDLLAPSPTTGRIHATTGSDGARITVTDESGNPVAVLRGVTMRPVGAPATLLHRIGWRTAVGRAPRDLTGRRIAVAYGPGDRELAERLAGDSGAVFAWPTAYPWTLPIEPDEVILLARQEVDTENHRHGEGAHVLLRLVRALSNGGFRRRAIGLTVVTAQVIGYPGEEPRTVGAELVGMAATVAAENPTWHVRVLDLATGLAPDAAVEQLRVDAESGVATAIRDGDAYMRTLIPDGTGAVEAGPLRDHGVYLVVGATGGIGSHLCRYLARRHRARLMLIGRRPADDTTADLVALIHRLGGEAVYRSVDVTDTAALTEAVAECRRRFGRLDGAFHSALRLADRSLATMTHTDLAEVMAPKVAGAVALADALAGEDPDFLVYFSSAITVTRSAGQGNYAAAGTFEDAHARRLNHRSRFPVVVVNWGFWGSVGAVADRDHLERFAERDIGSIEPDEGMAALDHVLRRRIGQAVVIKAGPRGLAHLLGQTDPIADGRAAFDALDELTPRLVARRLTDAGLLEPAPIPIEQLYRRWNVPERNRRLAEAVVDLLVTGGAVERDGDMVTAHRPVSATGEERLLARHPEVAAHVELLGHCVAALPDVLAGNRTGTEVLFPNGSTTLVEAIYRGNAGADRFHELTAERVTAAARRAADAGGGNLRVLEVGAGTGSGSRAVLAACERVPVSVSYHYTDISTAFLRRGEQSVGRQYDFITFATLDIERDPAEQGFADTRFDVIVATNVVHATSSTADSLGHLRRLLAPGGVLILNEATRARPFLTVTFGLTDGWWRATDPAARLAHAPLLSPAGWRRELTSAGFTTVEFHAADDTPEAELDQCVISAVRPVTTGVDRETAATYLRRVLAEVLRYAETDIADRTTFDEYGVDSLVALDIVARLERDLGKLPATLLFEYNTVERLADHVMTARHTRLAEALGTDTTTGTAPPPPVPAAAPTASVEDIAVIGVSGRYPGADDVDQLWRLLVEGRSGITDVPPERWDWRRYTSGEDQAGRRGGFLSDVDRFDPGFFGILPRDAMAIDPAERLFLETSWNLLEETGYLGRSRHEPETGVFAGSMYGSYGQLAATRWNGGELSGGHSAYWSIANRVSYLLDFTGPSFTVDSACSSSLLAVQLACESLRRGDCRMAVAGGVNVIIHPAHFASLAALNMLSPEGECKAFDATADGIVPGEGVGAVLLKPVARAVADGDRIWGVIKAGGSNAGGKTSGYTVPNPGAQQRLLAETIRRSGVDPTSIGYFELHGTGTALGDPIELAALHHALPDAAAMLGSVKANVGHLEGAAGIVGLTKVLLQMRHRTVTGCARLRRLNPKIDLDERRFTLPTDATVWDPPVHDGTPQPRRAGVSSFGAGGANVHLVVEEFPAAPVGETAETVDGGLFILSAKTPERLRVYAGAVGRFLTGMSGTETDLARLCRTSQLGRRELSVRLAVWATDIAELATALEEYSSGGSPETVADADNPDAALPPESAEPARRWIAGGDVDWASRWPEGPFTPVGFPTYPFDRRRFWLDAPMSEPATAGAAPRQDTEHCRYLAPEWIPSDRPVTEFRVGTLAVIGGDRDFARDLAAAAPATTLVEVDFGGPFDEADDRFTIDPTDAGHCRRLVETWRDRDLVPDVVVFRPPHTSTDPLTALADGPYCYLDVVTSILRSEPGRVLRALYVHDSRRPGPCDAAVAGAIRTLALEHRNFSGARVDGDERTPVTMIAGEIPVPTGEDVEVRLHGSQRLVRRLVEFTPPTSDALVVRSDGRYLVTGGTGGIGRHVVRALVDGGAAAVTVAGRSSPTPEMTQWIEGFAGRVEYRRADVSQPDEVAALVADCGRLAGIVHAAAITSDGYATTKNRRDVARVFAPKAVAAHLLDQATASHRLDFFVLFSSLAAEGGNPGQVDYAAANAFLNAFAESREAARAVGERHGATVAIGWPLWQDGGMAVSEPVRDMFAHRYGMTPMPTRAGLTAMSRILAGDRPCVAVTYGPGSADESHATADAAVPDVPVLTRLRELAAGFLLVDPEDVDLSEDLMEAGFDSVSLTEFVNRVNQTWSLDLLPTVFFEFGTLASFARHLTEQHVTDQPNPPVPAAAEPSGTDRVSSSAPFSADDRSRHEPTDAPDSSIAIIGMAGVLPGSPDLDAFWRHLANGTHLVGPPPADRRELRGHPDTAAIVGGFVTGIAEFDPEAFRISPAEARLMDPQQRIFLETACRAIEDSGRTVRDLAGSATGLFVGVSTSDYADLLRMAGDQPLAHTASGVSHAILANRVSHLLDLRGPSEAVDTACSSSLVALHHAVRALQHGDCDLAVVGGVNALLSPGLFTAFQKSGMLSSRGACRTFDADADGYVRGEGAGAVVLKPLAAARADGDPIHAVIRGSAIGHGGHATSLTAPNPTAQADVLVEAYRAASIDPRSVGYIEAHGTGTRLGDPIEVEGLVTAFGRLYAEAGLGPAERPHIGIGSVKSNIGHLEAAAGVAGVIKTVLAMRHRRLPATLHVDSLNSHLRLTGTPFHIVTSPQDWEPAEYRPDPVLRAGVSSFGFGGTNAHVVLESPRLDMPPPVTTPVAATRFRRRPFWFDRRDAVDEPVPPTREEPDHVPEPTTRSPRRSSRKVRLVPATGTSTTDAEISAASPPAATEPPKPSEPVPGTDIADLINGHVADILGMTPTELPASMTLTDLGLDSIFRMDLARRLNTELGIELQASELYDVDTVTALAEHVRRLSRSATAGSSDASTDPVVAETTPTTAEPKPSEVDVTGLVRELVTTVVAGEFDPDREFDANGLTSFDMLRVVSAMERALGGLPKTLLFDHPTVERLATHLTSRFDPDTLRRLSSVTPNSADEGYRMPSSPTGAAPTGTPPTVVRKREATARQARLLAAIDTAHAKESGLAGRDIAPLAFIDSTEECYLHFSRSGADLLAWNYSGSSSAFPKVAAEWFAYARRHGLRANLLSMSPLKRAGDIAVTATPFGAVQRIEDLTEFTLSGGAMSRLRYMVRRFARSGQCRTTEYRVGEDPAVDTDIAEMIADWAGGKQMVNPYVAVVADEIRSGSLASRHRVFLTRVDERLTNVIIVTDIPSESGYLLDLEFYPPDMPLGGLEFAIVAILERLREEGCEVFSFGASFGVELAETDNVASELAEALRQLRSVGVFGQGNFQFKNKFRPTNLPIYLCQSADSATTSAADVILMIAHPDLAADAPELPPTADEATPESAVLDDGPPRSPSDSADRRRRLAEAGHNAVALDHGDVDIDLLTDSWAERSDTVVTDRMRLLRKAAELRRGGFTAPDWLSGHEVVPTHAGRAAEALLCRQWPGPRGVVLHNELFPTWSAALAETGFDHEPIPVSDHGELAGDLDLVALDARLGELGPRVAFIAIELCCNASGGSAISLANLTRLRALADDHQVKLVLDATRILDNALLIVEHERPGPGPWEVVTKIAGLADALTASLSKNFTVTLGGLVATTWPSLAQRLTDHVAGHGWPIGLTDRRLLSAALADGAHPVEAVTQRLAATETMRRVLAEAGLPVPAGPAAHAVLVDTAAMPLPTGLRHPVTSLLWWLYADTGIRGGPHLGQRGGIRLAIPVGMTVAEAGEAAERIVRCWTNLDQVPDLVAETTDRSVARYRPLSWLPEDIGVAVRENHRPHDDNAAILGETTTARRHLLDLSGGTVEVFTAGEGPVVLLAHPFNIGAGVYTAQFRELADDFRLICVHHPGAGATDWADDLTLDGLADLAAEALERLHVTDPIHVVGSSFGGLVAQSFALRHPTASLSLIASSYKVGNRHGEVNRLSLVAEADFDAVFSDADPRRDRLMKDLLRCESMNPQLGLRYLDVFATQPDLLSRLPDIEAATMIVQGARDTVIPTKTAHLLHGLIPDVRYEEIADAGHFPTLTHPDRVNELLRSFLTGGGRP